MGSGELARCALRDVCQVDVTNGCKRDGDCSVEVVTVSLQFSMMLRRSNYRSKLASCKAMTARGQKMLRASKNFLIKRVQSPCAMMRCQPLCSGQSSG